MQIARKVAISLLVCVILFAGVCVFAFTNLFNIVETRFYDRTVLNGLNGELAACTDFADGYLDELQGRFSNILRESVIKKSFAIDRSNEDIYERGRILDALCVSLPELLWMRFVDVTGTKILYSTNHFDRIPTDLETVQYKNYYDTSEYIPFDQQMLSGINLQRILFDEANERIVFYFPLYDSMDIRRGEALFSVAIQGLGDQLTRSSRIRVTDDISIISKPDGIMLGIPSHKAALLKNAIVSVWESGNYKYGRLNMPYSESLVVLSEKTSQGVIVGLVVPEKLFSFPASLKALLIGAAFITLFIVFFLIVNMKQEPVAIVQSRLKELQVSLMHEYYQLMGDMDWAVWRRELEQRRDDVRNELCRGIKMEKGGDIEGYINSFFNRSWDGLLAAIGSRTGMITTFDEAKLEAILSRVLSASKPSGTDYDYEFHSPRHDSYDIEEFPTADAHRPPDAPVTDSGQSDYPVKAGSVVVYDDIVKPVGKADDSAKFAEAEPDVPAVNGGRSDVWEELEEVGEIDETEDVSGRFFDNLSLFTYSPRNMYAPMLDTSAGISNAGPAGHDEDLPELHGGDAGHPGEAGISYGEFICEAAAEDSEEPVIKKRSDGIDYIDSAALAGTASDTDNVDPEMKRLVESVLHKPSDL